jgi:hypothetical protein
VQERPPVTACTEPDGSLTIPVNLYSGPLLLRFLVPGLAYDAPGDEVFASEKCQLRGTDLTFRQTPFGYNAESKEGLEQMVKVMREGTLPIWWLNFKKKDYSTTEEMYRALSFYKVTRRGPLAPEDDDEFVVDLLMLPVNERLGRASSWDPDRLILRIIKIIRTFVAKEAYVSYKDTYKTKLLTVMAAFQPHRKEFLKFEIDPQAKEDSMYQLLMFFS